MLKISTKIEIKGNHSIEQLIDKGLTKPLKRNILDLSIITQRVLRTAIKSGARRSYTGKLAKAITVEIVENSRSRYEVGIGNISILNSIAPYWYVVNYGKRFDTGVPYVPPAFRGSFAGNPPVSNDGGKYSTGMEKAIMDGQFSIKPKKPIRPLRYIQAGLNWYFTNVSLYLNKK